MFPHQTVTFLTKSIMVTIKIKVTLPLKQKNLRIGQLTVTTMKLRALELSARKRLND